MRQNIRSLCLRMQKEEKPINRYQRLDSGPFAPFLSLHRFLPLHRLSINLLNVNAEYVYLSQTHIDT